MSEQVQDYVRVLQEWKEQTGKRITEVLTRIDNTKVFKGQDLDIVYKGVADFHKEIGKAEEALVDLKWFELCINSKKKLKKLQEAAEKQKKNQPALEKRWSSNLIVDYPQELTAGKGPLDEKLLKFLYKSFVTNYEEAMSEPKTSQFIILTLKEIKYKFDDKLDGSMSKRVMSIGTRLSKEGSKQSKIKMLNGEITPKELSNDDEELYFDEKTRENIRRIQLEQLQRSRTGFYDEMKKQINKGASEECRFCHKKAAYCEDQKQIRASDEPMTRFMRCNACEKAWRD